MNFVYFVSFNYADDEGGLNGRRSGNGELYTPNKITTIQQIKAMEYELEKKHGLVGVIITNFVLLRG